jgi:hypothetical protein
MAEHFTADSLGLTATRVIATSGILGRQSMDIDLLRDVKSNFERMMGESLDGVIRDFQDQTGVRVRAIAVSIDTMGTAGRDLQRHYARPKVTLELDLEGL